jgi:hypothetical protein
MFFFNVDERNVMEKAQKLTAIQHKAENSISTQLADPWAQLATHLLRNTGLQDYTVS